MDFCLLCPNLPYIKFLSWKNTTKINQACKSGLVKQSQKSSPGNAKLVSLASLVVTQLPSYGFMTPGSKYLATAYLYGRTLLNFIAAL